MFNGLRTASYQVEKLDEAKRWYTEVLGFEPYFDQPFYVGFNVAGYELGLIPGGSASKTPAGVSVYWAVDDVPEAVARLVGLGARLHEPARDVGDGIVVATVLDPDGNILGIIDNPNFVLPAGD